MIDLETDKQRQYINDIATTLNLKQPEQMTKADASKWIQEHVKAFDEKRIDTVFHRMWHQEVWNWHDYI